MSQDDDTGSSRSDETMSDQTGELTGRYIIVFDDEVLGDPQAMQEAVQSTTGVSNVVSTLEFDDGALDPEAADIDAIVFAELGVAVVAADLGSLDAVEADARIIAVEPERIMYAIEDRPVSLEYVRGYRDGVSGLYDRLADTSGEPGGPDVAAAFADNATSTWGLQAVRAMTSTQVGCRRRRGRPRHGLRPRPPRLRRSADRRRSSFVTGQSVDDGHGHGTHCVGTATGPITPPGGSRRYGVAHSARILVGKVLEQPGLRDRREHPRRDQLGRRQPGCRVISMSLGANVRQVSMAYEVVGRRALQAGQPDRRRRREQRQPVCRQRRVRRRPCQQPVDHGRRRPSTATCASPTSRPAATRSPAARSTSPAPASPSTRRGRCPPATARSRARAWPPRTSPAWPRRSARRPANRGAQLWTRLVQTARPLTLPSADVGAGLAQSPQ